MHWWHNGGMHRGNAEVGGEGGTYSYSYVPGAGDDEESWAQGLTPALFWKHQQVSMLPVRAKSTLHSCQQAGIRVS